MIIAKINMQYLVRDLNKKIMIITNSYKLLSGTKRERERESPGYSGS